MLKVGCEWSTLVNRNQDNSSSFLSRSSITRVFFSPQKSVFLFSFFHSLFLLPDYQGFVAALNVVGVTSFSPLHLLENIVVLGLGKGTSQSASRRQKQK